MATAVEMAGEYLQGDRGDGEALDAFDEDLDEEDFDLVRPPHPALEPPPTEAGPQGT